MRCSWFGRAAWVVRQWNTSTSPGSYSVVTQPRSRPIERSVAHTRGVLTAWLNGQAAQRAWNGSERHPSGEHVLHRLVVLMDHVAGLMRNHGSRIDNPRKLEGITKSGRSKNLTHQIGQRADKWDLVEVGLGQNPPVAGIGERVTHPNRSDRCLRPRREGMLSPFGPARRLEMAERRTADALHHVCIEQLAHEDVAVSGDALPERSPIAQQGFGVCQLGGGLQQMHACMIAPKCVETMRRRLGRCEAVMGVHVRSLSGHPPRVMTIPS